MPSSALMMRRPPRPPLFPYTTLFRSAMWFGTETGLARFDGRRTQTINNPALPFGRILALQTDQDGALWIGTEAGAARYSAGEFTKIEDRKSTRLNSSHSQSSYAVFCFNDAPTSATSTLSLHDALPICHVVWHGNRSRQIRRPQNADHQQSRVALRPHPCTANGPGRRAVDRN